MKNISLVIMLVLLTLSACTVGKVTQLNSNGYFPTRIKAETIKSVDCNLDSNRKLLVVPNDKFVLGLSKNIEYFDEVIKLEEFEEQIIKAGKQDEVGSLSGKIGLNNAYRKYKPFLYIVFDEDEEIEFDIQLKLVNPNTLEELFIADVYPGSNINDQNTFYPLFNELISYIKSNSGTYPDNDKQ